MAREALIAAMNAQLSAEYQAMVQYVHYAATVTGPHRPELTAFFKAEIPDEQIHAQYLADKIAALGAVPTTNVLPVPAAGSARAMLEAVESAESAAVAAYAKLIELADAAGEVGIRIQMETFLQDESSHRDEVRMILQGW